MHEYQATQQASVPYTNCGLLAAQWPNRGAVSWEQITHVSRQHHTRSRCGPSPSRFAVAPALSTGEGTNLVHFNWSLHGDPAATPAGQEQAPGGGLGALDHRPQRTRVSHGGAGVRANGVLRGLEQVPRLQGAGGRRRLRPGHAGTIYHRRGRSGPAERQLAVSPSRTAGTSRRPEPNS